MRRLLTAFAAVVMALSIAALIFARSNFRFVETRPLQKGQTQTNERSQDGHQPAVERGRVLTMPGDPLVGLWKMSPEKSKYTAGVGPKEETIAVIAQGDKYQFTLSGSMPDDSPISLKYTYPKACDPGCTGQVQSGPYDSISLKRTGMDTLDSAFMMGGKEVRSVHSVVAKDGETQTVTVKGMDAQGKQSAGVLVFDKQ